MRNNKSRPVLVYARTPRGALEIPFGSLEEPGEGVDLRHGDGAPCFAQTTLSRSVSSTTTATDSATSYLLFSQPAFSALASAQGRSFRSRYST